MAGILFVRHQETEENITGIIQGQSIEGRLTPRGKTNAEYICKQLYTLYSNNIRSIYSSPLKRAIDSITQLSEITSLPIVQDQLLAERYFGKYEGQSVDDLIISEERISTKDFDAVEPIDDVLDRVYTFIEKIKGKGFKKNDLVIASTHQLIIEYAINIGCSKSRITKKGLKTYDVPNGFSYHIQL